MNAVTLRPLTLDDGAVLVDLINANRKFLHGWMPAGDRESDSKDTSFVSDVVAECATGAKWFGLICMDKEPVGALSLRITRSIAQTAAVGYWVAERVNGRGVATQAVARCLDLAFGELGLHKVEAFAREDNVGSIRVLEKNDFERNGVSRSHLHIGGRWWDMAYFQKLAPWHDGVRLTPPPGWKAPTSDQ